MEHKIHRLLTRAKLRLNVILRLLQNRRLQLHIPRLVNAMHIAERRRNREIRANFEQRLVSMRHLIRLSVKAGLIHIRIVHSVFLTTRHTQLNLQRHPHLRHPLQIPRTSLNVLLQRLLREIQHVRTEQRPSRLRKMPFARLEHPVHPWQQLLRAMVRVQNHRHPVSLRRRIHIMRPRDRSQNRPQLVLLAYRLPNEELRSPVRKLNHHRRVHLTPSRQ